MNYATKIRPWLVVTLLGLGILILIIFVLSIFGLLPASKTATTITLIGEGQELVVPQSFPLTLNVAKTETTYDQALAELNAATASVYDIAKKSGIDDSDVLKQNFNASSPSIGNQKYIISQSFLVNVRDYSKLQEIKEELATLGSINDYVDPNSLPDLQVHKNAAIEKALDDAKARANETAAGLNKKVINVLSFTPTTRTISSINQPIDPAIAAQYSPDVLAKSYFVVADVTTTFTLK